MGKGKEVRDEEGGSNCIYTYEDSIWEYSFSLLAVVIKAILYYYLSQKCGDMGFLLSVIWCHCED
jgi:hypothetical protein